MNNNFQCRLCNEQSRLQKLNGDDDREYYWCHSCNLISVDGRYFLSVDEEQEIYETHNNTIKDERYVNFLNRIIDPMLEFIAPGMQGVDYGCGPGPTLSQLVRRKGIDCDDYDPIFYPIQLRQQYDFIFCTETIEHFFYPKAEIEKLATLLVPDGFLGVMTQMWESVDQFGTWRYTRDPTHVSFYHHTTFDYICRSFGFEKRYSDDKRIIVMQKK